MRRASYIVSFFMITILLLGSTSAISTSIKNSYNPGETVITEVSGNILEPIIKEDIELKRISNISGRPISVPIDFEVEKLGESYYVWFTAPEIQENYTLFIKDITTTVSGQVQGVDYEKNFSVSGNLTDYSVRPGFISTNESFELEVQLNEDYNKQIDLEFLEETNVTLKPGKNTLKFSISDINESGLFNLTIGKYNLPAYIQIEDRTFFSYNETEIIDLTNLTIFQKNLTTEEEEAINRERLKHYCSEYPGKICSADEICSVEPIASLDGQCCVNGECVSKEEEGVSSAWIGYLLAAIVIIVGIIIWIRYKKVKTEKDHVIKKIVSQTKRIP